MQVYFDTVHSIFFAVSPSNSVRVKENATKKLNILTLFLLLHVISNFILLKENFSMLFTVFMNYFYVF